MFVGIRVLSAVLSSPNGHNALIIAARPHAGGGVAVLRSTYCVVVVNPSGLFLLLCHLEEAGTYTMHTAKIRHNRKT